MPEPITLVGMGAGVLGLMTHLARRYFDTAKGIADAIVGSVLLLVSLPVLVVCAILIKVSSPGPVFFTQVRVGKRGKLFRMYKLRSMRSDAERGRGAVWAQKNDPRVIPACRWMRRSHVDELPQLINVVKGEMSLVGPRPERPVILHQLKQSYPDVTERLAVLPGITGLAQVRNGYDTDLSQFRKKLDADLEYIAKRRWALEFAIIARTFGKFRDTTAH